MQQIRGYEQDELTARTLLAKGKGRGCVSDTEQFLNPGTEITWSERRVHRIDHILH